MSRSIDLDEMRATKGWKDLYEELVRRYQASANALIHGTSTDQVEISQHRARCKLIREVLASAGVSKEDCKWMNLL